MSGPVASARRWPTRALGWVLALFYSVPGFAQLADIPLSQLHHMQWTVHNGAPSGMTDMVQTRDGYIWVLGNGRLFRFDGVEFERIQQVGGQPLPADRVYMLWARPAGGLWISYPFGGATFIGEDGRSQSYSTDAGLPANAVTSFAEDGEGRMWLGTTRGLFRLEDGRWLGADETWQFPQDAVFGLRLDGEGTLWVRTRDALYFQPRGEHVFKPALQADARLMFASLLEAPDGRVWLARDGSGLAALRAPPSGQALSMDWQPLLDPDDGTPELMIDRDSNLWRAAWDGVTRVPLRAGDGAGQGAAWRASDAEPIRLLGETPGTIMQDREGNVWARSNGGLSRFRRSALAKVKLERASYGTAAIAAADDRSVWASDSDNGLHRLQDGLARESFPSRHETFSVLHRDHTGTLWFGGRAGSIYRRRGEEWVEWRSDDADAAGGIQAIVSQSDGSLWVSVVRAGVYRVVDNRWTPWGGLPGLPREPATSMAVGPDDRLWLGYVGNRLAIVERGQVTLYDTTDGLATGAVQVMAVAGSHVWIGGEKGLSRFDGERFHTVRGGEQHTFGNVTGLIERAGGEVWLNTSDGAVSIDASEVAGVVADPAHPVRFRLFDHLDGTSGAAQHVGPWPTAVESTDGRLWFTTSNGVVTLAPQPPPRNPVVPDVYIKSITVDGHRTSIDGPTQDALQLPTRPLVVRVAYTAPSFTIPERVHFRYRLEGSEMGWEEVGTRREAFFTGLPPGSYRFQVTAANESGVWNEAGASVAFVVPPTFMQSRVFLLACVVAGAGAIWLLFVLRMRQVKAKLQWRNEARLMERERIARDLHDTFLQGVQGLMLRFQSAAERIPEGERARELMEEALDRADRVLTEGRDKVAELRASVSLDLPEALALSGNELARDYGVAFQALVEGSRRELNPLVQEEAFLIGAEALANAFRHARATRISVTTVFGRRQMELRIRDDGSGFDVSGVRHGHWGLQGLQERAARIRAKLVVASEPGVGTTVELRLPAKWAYTRARGHRTDAREDVGTPKEDQP